jgi:hypothetical protein
MVDGSRMHSEEGVKIAIDFKEPGQNYRAGGKVEGVVKLAIDGFYDASSLMLSLKGEDFVNIV